MSHVRHVLAAAFVVVLFAVAASVTEAAPRSSGAKAATVRVFDGAPGKRAVVGGTVIGIQNAPWQLYLETQTGSCGASILTATTVLTAAHCVDSAVAGQSPENGGVGVLAGLSHLDTLPISPSDKPQYREASAIRIHPSWPRRATTTGDVAVVTLASALELDGVTARAVTLPPLEQVPVGDALAGTGVSVTGYGVNNAGFPQNTDGALRSGGLSVADPDFCDVDENAVTICGQSPTGSSCQGDSGGPLVIAPAAPGASPVQVGIVSNGPLGCQPGSPDFYTNLYAPEVRAFIDGKTPPAAPRRGPTDPVLTGPLSMREGDTISCAPAAFNGASSVETKLLTDAGTVLATAVNGPATFVLTAAQAGRTIRCRSYGSSAGGVAVSYLMAFTTAVTAKPVVPVKPPVLVGSCAPAERGTRTLGLVGLPGRPRRGKSYNYEVIVSQADSGQEVMVLEGGQFRRGSKTSPIVRGSVALEYSRYGIEGVSIRVKTPSWVKLGKNYKLTFVARTHPVGDPVTTCLRRSFTVTVRPRR